LYLSHITFTRFPLCFHSLPFVAVRCLSPPQVEIPKSYTPSADITEALLNAPCVPSPHLNFKRAGAKFKRYKAKCAASKKTCGKDDTDCIPALTSLKAMDTVRYSVVGQSDLLVELQGQGLPFIPVTTPYKAHIS
jgi:hypothetical protein